MSLDPDGVPEPLRYLLPLAERWGIGDDYDRCSAVDDATAGEREVLITTVADAPELLWEWLVAESHPPYSAEWAALTDLTQAYDYARARAL